MFKDILFKAATPLVCALAIAFAPIGVSAAQYYNYSNNNCCATDCCDPCQQDPCCPKKSSWLGNAAIFAGAAAVGAIAGVVAAESNKKRGRTGPQGEQGIPGVGFTLAPVPGTLTPITSLTFTFTTTIAISAAGTFVDAYVTTPDGRTFFGVNLDGGLPGNTITVNVPAPAYIGQYNVGVIAPSGLATVAGLIDVQLTLINGIAPGTPFDIAGILTAITVATATDKFFNAQYPFPETP